MTNRLRPAAEASVALGSALTRLDRCWGEQEECQQYCKAMSFPRRNRAILRSGASQGGTAAASTDMDTVIGGGGGDDKDGDDDATGVEGGEGSVGGSLKRTLVLRKHHEKLDDNEKNR